MIASPGFFTQSFRPCAMPRDHVSGLCFFDLIGRDTCKPFCRPGGGGLLSFALGY
ncbi:hypothetical protein [Nostoc sp. CCY0012]|uniref:hypothetical protein n=1 Tax=Nostoc sp. CCY0012 TaxID=1056123 RepID=UPI0039C6AE5E